MAVELSYCVVSTEQRQLLRYCLDAIARERATVPFETEVLVLDNASQDGSAGAASAHPATTAVIAADERRGRAANHGDLLRHARGRFCLLLNEDSELEPGATAALHEALAGVERAAAAGATLVDPEGEPQPSAWRFPGVGSAFLAFVGLYDRCVVQSHGNVVREVDWCPPAALLVRREAAAEIGWFDPAFFLATDGADFGKRLAERDWKELWVPDARAVHHDQPTEPELQERRIVEHARNRDRYVRKHQSAAAARVVAWLTAARFTARAVIAVARPGRDAGREFRRAAAALFPGRGEGLAEAAAELNRRPPGD
jgi:N-acetylglucosaminyl-diphospho-decaprenol L-rhamnosyltransferase